MPDRQPDPSPSAWSLKLIQMAGIAVFALATVIALALLWQQEVSHVQKFWMMVGWLIACGAVVISYLTTIRNRGNAAQVIPATVVFDSVCFIAGGLVVVSFYSSSNPLIGR